MVQKFDDSDLVNLKEFLLANSIQVDGGIQIFIDKKADKKHLNSIDEVVDEIIDDLTLAERVGTADLNENEFCVLELTLGKLIRFKLDSMEADVNKELMKDCLAKAGEPLNEADAAVIILRKIWERLRESHRLRVVK